MVKLRVLVVEDSLTVRRRLCEVLTADPEIEVVAEGENGQQAIELCQLHRPDVVTLDMQLPVVNGLAATEHIMAHFPTPILIVSASTNRGELFDTYDALAAGAVDVLEKPRGDATDAEWENRFLAAVKLVSRIRVITHPRARLGGLGRASTPMMPAVPASNPSGSRNHDLIALGASTGGPSALVEVLRGIPVGLPVTTLVVLHIDEPFGAAFAEWLNGQTRHSVRYPVSGEPLAAARGSVLMAPPGRHLEIQEGRAIISNGPERHSCKPSIDVLFESLARDCGARTIACLLTGMGRDGAAGLLQIRRAGGATIAQDEQTSIVYGMPREAALIGAAERVLPISQIGPAVAHLIELGKGRP
jgi:two-component system chemotaxis response regulator CheB